MSSTPKIILAIETATQKGSLSLLKDEKELGFWVGDNSQTLSSALLPQIDRLVTENNLALNDLKLIAVSAGPGSFTGVRIGLAAARAFKTGLGIPSIAVSLLEAMAWSVKEAGLPIVSLIPAGRDGLYGQEFSPQNEGITPASDIAVRSIDEIAAILTEGHKLSIAAPGLKPEQAETIEKKSGRKIHIANDNLARNVGELAAYKSNSGESAGNLSPIYVKEFAFGK